MGELTLRDDTSLRYADRGRGRPVVFLHGWGMDGSYFAGQIDALADGYRCIAPDLRAHGRSGPLAAADGTDPLDALAGDVAALLEALELDDVTLVGWSMGAMVAWRLLEGPAADRVSSLVVIDMVPRLLNGPGWPHGVRDGEDAAVFDDVIGRMKADWAGFTRVFVPRIVAAGKTVEHSALLARMAATAARNDPAAMGRLWRSIASHDFRDTVERSAVPCLVTYGAKSQLYGEPAMRWLVAHAPDARAVRFEESGHAPHLEEPERFNTELASFLADPAGNATNPQAAEPTT